MKSDVQNETYLKAFHRLSGPSASRSHGHLEDGFETFFPIVFLDSRVSGLADRRLCEHGVEWAGRGISASHTVLGQGKAVNDLGPSSHLFERRGRMDGKPVGLKFLSTLLFLLRTEAQMEFIFLPVADRSNVPRPLPSPQHAHKSLSAPPGPLHLLL